MEYVSRRLVEANEDFGVGPSRHPVAEPCQQPVRGAVGRRDICSAAP